MTMLDRSRDDSASSSTNSSVPVPKPTALADETGRGSYDAFTFSSPEMDVGGLHHDMNLDDSGFCNDIDTFLSSSLDDRLPMLPIDIRLPMPPVDVRINDGPTLVSSSGTSDANFTETSLQNSSLGQDTAGPEQHRSISNGPNASATKPADNRSLQVCFCSIASLEAQLKQGSKSVDEVMHTNKTCAQELRSAMQLDSYRRSAAGPMLVLTAVELMTLLYESSIPPKLGLTGADLAFPTPARIGSTNTELSYPSLLLGNFKADPEEAAIIWRHVLLGELRRVLHLIDMLSVYRQDTQCRQNCPRATSSYRTLCDDLEQRIKSLITALEDSQR